MAEEETTYYDFDGMAAFVKGGAFRLVSPAGEKRIEDIARFLQEAQPISKEQFDRMCAGGRADAGESKAGREPLFFVHPDDLDTPKKQEDFAQGVADAVLEFVDEERKKAGLEPLKD
jgi:hypothetical protein